MNTSKRSVSFVENLQLEISDNLNNEALLLADVDNDGDSELVVGQINGELSIFKGSSAKPWKRCLHLGMITCVAVGDLWNKGENFLFCITAEGLCHIFYITSESTEETLKPISSQLLPSNCKIILLADVDGDGTLELVTGHADRAVFVHKLVNDCHKKSGAANQQSTEKEEQKKKDSTSESSNKHDLETIMEKGLEKPQKVNRKDLTQQEADAKCNKLHCEGQKAPGGAANHRNFSHHVVTVNHWTVPRQIGSLVVFDVETSRYLLASYPGGSYAILKSWNLSQQEEHVEQISSSPSKSTLKQLPLVWGRSKDIPINLLTLKSRDHEGPVSNSTERQTHLVLCTQDGHVILMNGNKLQWSLRIDQGFYNLFALSKLDISGDGNEEIVLCSWDGNTHIIDRLKNVAQFKFGENVMGFCSGNYAFTPGKNLPALVYATSSSRVVRYWNARLSLMVPTNLDVKMKNEATKDEEAKSIIDAAAAKDGENNNATKLYQQCLYGT